MKTPWDFGKCQDGHEHDLYWIVAFEAQKCRKCQKVFEIAEYRTASQKGNDEASL
jgi:hypothetical protein